MLNTDWQPVCRDSDADHETQRYPCIHYDFAEERSREKRISAKQQFDDGCIGIFGDDNLLDHVALVGIVTLSFVVLVFFFMESFDFLQIPNPYLSSEIIISSSMIFLRLCLV